jgi:alkanesulfonate monooxygenase
MLEYRDLGIETFILSGYPHLEEAYRVAELLFARLPLAHDEHEHRGKMSFHGEIAANNLLPRAAAAS